MTLKTALASLDRELTDSERKVVNVLLLDVESGAATAASVAKRAGTHETTVIRLARKLGYRGYPELRESLRQRGGDQPEAGEQVMRSSSGPDLRSFIDDEVRALRRVADFISQADLDAAARTLQGANRVYITGNNDSRPLLALLDRRLRRVGLTVVPMIGTPKDVAEHFVGFDENSVLVAFVLQQAPAYLGRLMAEAQRLGGKTVMIADLPGFAFRPQPNHLLAAPRDGDPGYHTTVVPTLICYALQLAIYHLDADQNLAVRHRIEDLIRLTGGQDEIVLKSPGSA
ncbi:MULTISPECIES: MurR/RpiR family transcriptional regulator [unclassified Knoellia]|uniref:MurR/RpiR family transcriptional regulator n=1 Tax=Knoellia altitudinis TaxID=3404795 RepID=UPI003616F694